MSAGRALFAVVCLSVSLLAQPSPENLIGEYLREGETLGSLVEPIVTEVRPFVVEVLDEDDVVGLGMLVGEVPHLLTKATWFRPGVRFRLAGGRVVAGRLLHVDDPFDVAVFALQTEGVRGLSVCEEPVAVGCWVVAPRAGQREARVGVVGTPPRRIPSRVGFLGVSIEDAGRTGVKIVRVIPDTAAERAELRVGDVIRTVGGVAVKGRSSFVAAVGANPPGAAIELEIVRDDRTLTVEATLGEREDERSSRRSRTFDALSRRRGGFPLAFQHDAIVRAQECGGPVLDIRGRVIGMNVARAGRTQTLAIPARSLLAILSRAKKK